MCHRYKPEDIAFTTVSEATDTQLVALVKHVAQLTEAEDGEEPESYLSWILEHGLRLEREPAERLSRIFTRVLQQAQTLLGELQGAYLQEVFTDLFGIAKTMAFNAPVPGYLPPHQIYLAYDRASNRVLDIAGFVPDDRDVGQIQGLAEQDPNWIGFFGGHNVARDVRGCGIGSLMIHHRVRQIQQHVDTARRRPATVYSFLTNEVSGKLLVERGGFEYVGTWYIKYFGKEEHIFRRRFELAE